MLARPNLWVLPANIDLVGAESELVNVVGREIILREALEPIQDQFDYCLIDCAPSLGILTLNALAAAEEVLIPLQPHFLALQGFGKLLQTVDLVNRRINPKLKVTGILLCMFDSRASLPNEVKADIEQFLENARGSGSAWEEAEILPTYIRRNIKLAEAPSYGKTIFEYEMNCNGAQDYLNVGRYIAQMGQSDMLAPEPEPELEPEPEPKPIPIEDTSPQPQPEIITIEDLEPSQSRRVAPKSPTIESTPGEKSQEDGPRTPRITYPSW
jgi:chromosome partitioning protein